MADCAGTAFGCKCPQCGSNTAVVDTRQGEDGSVHRRRRCPNCDVRFNTVESFAGWDAGRRAGRRPKYTPEARLLAEAKAAAASVPVGSSSAAEECSQRAVCACVGACKHGRGGAGAAQG